MLWVYDHYKYVYSYSARIVVSEFSGQILTTKVDPRAVRVKIECSGLYTIITSCQG